MPGFFKIIIRPRVKTSAVMAVSILLTLLLLTLSLPAWAGRKRLSHHLPVRWK